MPTTHYVPAFVPAGRHPQAVCGAFVHSDAEFSVEPTCPTCKAWLESDTTTIESFDVDRSVVGEPVDPYERPGDIKCFRCGYALDEHVKRDNDQALHCPVGGSTYFTSVKR